MNLVKEVPCLHCNERHNLCHSTCEKYIKYVQAQKALKETLVAFREADDFVHFVRRPKKNNDTQNKVFRTHKK